MNIGQAAAASGISAKMIRHYEAVGLLPKPPRSASGYRRYEMADVQRLRFVQSARAAGFAIADVKKLLNLWQSKQRPAREVKRVAQAHLTQIQTHIAQLNAVATSLAHLIDHCSGNERPECPILASFSGGMPQIPLPAGVFGLRPHACAQRKRLKA